MYLLEGYPSHPLKHATSGSTTPAVVCTSNPLFPSWKGTQKRADEEANIGLQKLPSPEQSDLDNAVSSSSPSTGFNSSNSEEKCLEQSHSLIGTGERATVSLSAADDFGRSTIKTNSSLGDSVSRRGESRAVMGSTLPGSSCSILKLLPPSSYQLDARPAAGLPLPSNNSDYDSFNSSHSSASGTLSSSSFGSSMYAEASAAASFYSQRQRQHSTCIFGDKGLQSSVMNSCHFAKHRQRIPSPPVAPGESSPNHFFHCSDTRWQEQQADKPPAGRPTAAWTERQKQQHQQHLTQQLQPLEEPFLVNGYIKNPRLCGRQEEQQQCTKREYQYHQVAHPNSNTLPHSLRQKPERNETSSLISDKHTAAQHRADTNRLHDGEEECSNQQQQNQETDSRTTTNHKFDLVETRHCSHRRQSQEQQSEDRHEEKLHKITKTSSGEFPADANDKQQKQLPSYTETEQEKDLEDLPSVPPFSGSTQLLQQLKERKHEKHQREGVCVQRCLQQPLESADQTCSYERGSEMSAPSATSRTTYEDYKSLPRGDLRSSRQKQIEALRSTGCVLPLSAAAAGAAATGAAFASGKKAKAASATFEDDSPYPLSMMGDKKKRESEATTQTNGSTPLLPLESAGHKSASSALGSRESVHQQNQQLLVGCSSLPVSPSSSRGASEGSNATSSAGSYAQQQQLTARERMFQQHCRSSIFSWGEEGHKNFPMARKAGRMTATTAAVGGGGMTAFLDPDYVIREDNLRRRADQLQNTWYSDLFGRRTPKRSIAATTEICTQQISDKEADGNSDSGTRLSGSLVSNLDGATIDKVHASQRKEQLLRAPNAYARFLSAMHSDILCAGAGLTDAKTASRLLDRAHLAKESLLKEKKRDQRRRQQLRAAVAEGNGRSFHMSSSEEVGLNEHNTTPVLTKLKEVAAKRKTLLLHLDGLHPHMTEEELQNICMDGAENQIQPQQLQDLSPQVAIMRRSSRCNLLVNLATDLLTSKCKGYGRLLLRYEEDQLNPEEVIRRLNNANVAIKKIEELPA